MMASVQISGSEQNDTPWPERLCHALQSRAGSSDHAWNIARHAIPALAYPYHDVIVSDENVDAQPYCIRGAPFLAWFISHDALARGR